MMAKRLDEEREKTRQMRIAVDEAENEVYRESEQDLQGAPKN